jgi:pimeloyl-ACP methyl ester carboxylesterase
MKRALRTELTRERTGHGETETPRTHLGIFRASVSLWLVRSALLLVVAVGVVGAQSPSPTPPPTAVEIGQIQAKVDDLAQRVTTLRRKGVDAALVADADVYRKAAEYILRFPEEFVAKEFVPNTLAVLEIGIARAKELESGTPSWPKRTGRVVRAYVSRVDGSVQPYGLTIPASYDGKRPMRLDIWQHGTNRAMNEVAFIVQQEADRPIPPEQDYIQLEPLGRTNVSYRWAGEADLFEALASVQQRYNIDPKRIVLRGFSMGGASSWHLGLHHPGRWAAIEAGAGYTETQRYGKRPDLPAYQRAMLHYYDAVDYSLNVFNTPTVGYGGETDGQLQASVNVREQLTAEGFRFQGDGPYRWITQDLRALFLVGPATGHSWHPDSKAQSNAFIAKALETADQAPSHVRFVTYTTRFNKAHWVTVDGLDRSYERADVDAMRQDAGKRHTVTTRNVSHLTIDGPAGVYTIDGQTITAPAKPSFQRAGGQWSLVKGVSRGLRKMHGLQGPVDDAFMEAFLCVRPSGEAWGPLTQEWAQKTYDVFSGNFAKWLRGDVRTKLDRDVTARDIADYNLVLFGDPGSNRLIARVLKDLPIAWSKTEIALAGQRFSAAEHVPVLIYPNPLNPARYVVINSGHTFGEEDFRGTNAWLYPRLGDYSVLKANGEIALSGFFDERWQVNQASTSR